MVPSVGSNVSLPQPILQLEGSIRRTSAPKVSNLAIGSSQSFRRKNFGVKVNPFVG